MFVLINFYCTWTTIFSRLTKTTNIATNMPFEDLVHFDNCCFPPFPPLAKDANKYLESLRNMKSRDDDVLLTSFPKCGMNIEMTYHVFIYTNINQANHLALLFRGILVLALLMIFINYDCTCSRSRYSNYASLLFLKWKMRFFCLKVIMEKISIIAVMNFVNFIDNILNPEV